MPRTIILSCSQRKRPDAGLLPAIKRYDGAAFRVLRRFLNNSDESPQIYILSAKFGLISPDFQIPNYEKKLRTNDVENLSRKIFAQKLNIAAAQNVFVNLGKSYLDAFGILSDDFSDVTIATGSSGKRLAMMHDWLWGEKSHLRQLPQTNKITNLIKLRGVELKWSKQEIFDSLRGEIQNSREAENLNSWFVKVGDFRISPKWLVSRISGLPVGEFHSDEARRVLYQLGIEVKRL